MTSRETKTCDECRSLYFADTSRMDQLCPECAHVIYGNERCQHMFVDGRCTRCWWDGTISEFCQTLMEEESKSEAKELGKCPVCSATIYGGKIFVAGILVAGIGLECEMAGATAVLP